MQKQVAPMIVVVVVWRGGVALPPYFADSEPDLSAVLAMPGITQALCRRAYLVYD